MRVLRIFTLIFLSVSFFSFSENDCDIIPPLNKAVITFVKTKIKKKVGKGECWDLAAEALDNGGARWNHDYVFGKEIDHKKDCVFPGDVIQFEGVEIEYRDKNTIFRENLAHHTAIVYEVKDKGSFIIAQQNTSMHGRKVSLDPLDLKNIKKGSFKIYRPEK